MSIVVKNKKVKEEIKDEEGNVIGILEFDPNDTRIMSKLTKIATEANDAIKKIKQMGELPSLSKELKTIEDFEKAEEDMKKVSEAFELENQIVENLFNGLYEIFGKEAIDAITFNTKNVELLSPLIDYITPYIAEARKAKVNKYMPKKSDIDLDVMN